MLILLAQAAAEPPPSGWAGPVESLVRHTQEAPNVMFPLLCALIPLAVIGGLALLYVRWHLPAQREERKLDRESLAKVLGDKDNIAATDMAQTRELAKAQQQALVTQIGDEVRRTTGAVEKLAEWADRHGELLRDVARKIGVGVLLVLLALGLVGGARDYLAQVTKNECAQHPCPSGQHCCGQDKCCKDTATALTLRGVPHSAMFADRRVDCSIEIQP